MATLQAWGHRVVPGPHLQARYLHTAGTANERLADLTWALTDPGIDAVWLARGGAGLVHLLPELPDTLPDRPVFGFSDGTALLLALHRRGHTQLWHAPVLQQLAPFDLQAAPPAVTLDASSRQLLRHVVAQGQQPPHAAHYPADLWDHPLLPQQLPQAAAPVLAGNLTVLASLCGTPWQLKASGAILVLEDLQEAPYRIDRCLQQLRLSGALDGVVAVVLGDFLQCKADGYTLLEVLAHALAPLHVPVLTGLPVGHGAHHWPIRLGALAQVQADGLHWQL